MIYPKALALVASGAVRVEGERCGQFRRASACRSSCRNSRIKKIDIEIGLLLLGAQLFLPLLEQGLAALGIAIVEDVEMRRCGRCGNGGKPGAVRTRR